MNDDILVDLKKIKIHFKFKPEYTEYNMCRLREWFRKADEESCEILAMKLGKIPDNFIKKINLFDNVEFYTDFLKFRLLKQDLNDRQYWSFSFKFDEHSEGIEFSPDEFIFKDGSIDDCLMLSSKFSKKVVQIIEDNIKIKKEF